MAASPRTPIGNFTPVGGLWTPPPGTKGWRTKESKHLSKVQFDKTAFEDLKNWMIDMNHWSEMVRVEICSLQEAVKALQAKCK